MAMILNPPGSTETNFGTTRPALLAVGMGITVSVNIFTLPRFAALAALNTANNSDPAAIRAAAWLSPDDVAAVSAAIASRNYL
jgi:hypothetical protein